MFSSRSRSLILLLGASLALGLAACAGDDDDAVPTPTPYDPDFCVIEYQGGTQTYFHTYRLILDAASLGGQLSYADGSAQSISAFGIPSGATSLFQAAVISAPNSGTLETAGTAGVEEGDVAAFDDTTEQAFLVLNTDFSFGAVLGSAGVGSFDGEWSPPADPGDFFPDFDTIVEGAGQVTIMGTNNTVAVVNGGVFAWCVKDLAFAPNLRNQLLTAPPVYRLQP